ncbi:P-loop containing nucleoside triphosphate hydrolase protein [Tothia fuscella]|uniref:P-loop containing nucleoside triphosphate hydrolase protein n=1 Tax=Tothia fuscella TaxID=1048955 RepID=A0A9P4NMV9_9PEZI|nr:P-loop containing nucleoside triphosphate hydrolase protein [Tothia fuscella]
MTDLLQVLVDFPTAQFSHLLPSLDKALITTSDLLTLDPVDVAKRAQLPPKEVFRLVDAILVALRNDLGFAEGGADGNDGGVKDVESNFGTKEWRCISTLDETIDRTLGGGIPTGYVTEITGESGAGKTQFLLTLLLSTQLPPPNVLASLPPHQRPSLDKVLSIQTPDLEAQDHIIRYQVPVAIQRHGIGLVVIDSIASNYRAEFERVAQQGGNGVSGVGGGNSQSNAAIPERKQGQAMGERRTQLVQLGAFLRNLARTENIAIVVSNQVADRFSPLLPINPPPHPQHQPHLPPPSTPTTTIPIITPDPLTLDHQQRWFTGWGDIPDSTNHKTPSLGLVWTNQIAARIALIKEGNTGGGSGGDELRRRRRWLRGSAGERR